MFNSFPAVFRNIGMATKACEAFEGEQGFEWIVLQKNDNDGGEWFKPCKYIDYIEDEYIKKEGWFNYEDLTLKPCPFCGGKADFFERSDGYFDIGCDTVGCYLEEGADWHNDDKKDLADLWNIRNGVVK